MTIFSDPEDATEQSTPAATGDIEISFSFHSFAQLCEDISRVSRKADKAQKIAKYFDSLHPEPLAIAARCLSGQVFPLREHRTLNINSLIILNSFAACSGVPVSFVRERMSHHNEIGNLAFELFNGGLPIVIPDVLSLSHVMDAMSQIAETSGTRRKCDTIVRLLRKASPLEAKYLVRLMTGDLQIGVQESDIEDSLSVWKSVSFGRIQSANMLLGDIGKIALLCSSGRIEEAQMRLFSPAHFMHATELGSVEEVVREFSDKFVVEDKFDGIRTQIHIGLDLPGNGGLPGAAHEGLRVALFSEGLEDVTGQFSDLVPALAALWTEQAGTVDAVGVILDGVIVAVRKNEIRPLTELLPVLPAGEDEASPAENVKAGFVAFDLLYSEGRALIQENWATRAARLNRTTFDLTSTFRARSNYVATSREVESVLEMALLRGSHGLVAKDPRSFYRPSSRGRDWVTILGKAILK